MVRHTQNTAELLSTGVILITKVGDQDGRSMSDLYRQVDKIAKKLRAQNKKVLLLSDNTREGEINLSGWKASDAVGRTLSFDKSATFGTSAITRAKRQYIISVEGDEQRVADFDTREEAEAWLLGSRSARKELNQASNLKPKFLPQTWAIFKVNNGRAMGEIVSVHDSDKGKGWIYDITDPVGKHNYKVPEADISHTLKGAYWVSTAAASDRE